MSKNAAQAEADAAIALLAELFPRCFAVYEARRRPLKVGIYTDIIGAVGGAIAPYELSCALRFYCGNTAYLRGLRVGAARFNLDGHAVGTVNIDEAAHAAETLASLIIKAANRRKAALNSAPTMATTGAPTTSRRLGLSDLRLAAQERKRRALTIKQEGA
jgi:sRNA-binding protein